MTQEPKMDSTLTLGAAITIYSVGIVTGMVALICLDAIDKRRQDRGLEDARRIAEALAEESKSYELSESMGRDLPPAA